MLSLAELRRAARVLELRLSGSVIQRSVQVDAFRLALKFYGPSDPPPVLLSCQPDFARIGARAEMPKAPPVAPSFAQYARAHLTRASFRGARVPGKDRQMSILLEAREGVYELILSILGARSNIYLLDSDGKLLHALRPLEETRRELRLGEQWRALEGAVKSEGIDRWSAVPDEGYLEAIEFDYEKSERARAFERLSRRVGSVLAKEEAFLAKKGTNLREDLGEARRAEEFRHKGELLKSVLHAIRPGDDAVTVTDYDTGEAVTIPLVPELTPAQNLEAYFERYQKQVRGASALGQQLESVEIARAEIETLRAKLDQIALQAEPDPGQLERFAAQPRIRKLLARYYPERKSSDITAKPARGKKEIPSRLLPKRYRTEQGFEIWVGRSDEGNDYLTTRLARGNDLFFHLEGYPGSHVVLRTGGRKDVPPGALLDACELAVHFSKMKDASRADVHVAAIKDIRKPKGAKPGLVYVARGKTIHLRRSPKRLQDILASRLDD